MEVYGLKKRFCGILCIVLMGFLLTGCNVEFGFNRKSNVSNNAEGNVNESIGIDGVDKINLQIAVADIDIYTVEGNDVIIERTCRGNNFGKLSIEKNGGKINVIEDEVKCDLGAKYSKNELKVGVPADYHGDMVLKNAVGDCEMKELKLSDVDIKTGVGDFDIENGEYNVLTLKQGTGDAEINLSYCGDMNIKGGVGDLKLNLESVNGNLIFKGGVGDADIYIPNNSPVSFKTSSGLGKCDIEVQTSGENTYVFDLNTGVGDIEVVGK